MMRMPRLEGKIPRHTKVQYDMADFLSYLIYIFIQTCEDQDILQLSQMFLHQEFEQFDLINKKK